MPIIVLFLALPLIEIALFVTIGGWLTVWPTLAIVLGTGILGVWVMRSQGLRAVKDLQSAQAAMRNPLSPMAHSALIMLAGVLLVLPGFFTDTLGLLLLIPPLRRLIILLIGARLRARVVTTGFAATPLHPAPPGDWEDAEFIEIAPDPTPPTDRRGH